MNDAAATQTAGALHILSLEVAPGWVLQGQMHLGVALLCALILVAIILVRFALGRYSTTSLEIDEAELGIGDQRLKLKPNRLDRQVAYKIWVELSTRKIGLPIDLDNDVISEICNSWHTFFGVTRDLIKDIPVSKVGDQNTQKIIRLSVDVLNNGLRPHLTRWQARFRRWYEKQLDAPARADAHPQDIQRAFPDFPELSADLIAVNRRLIAYREKMRVLVLGASARKNTLKDPKVR